MANITTTLTLDISQVRQAISQLDSSMAGYRQALDQVRDAQRQAFQANAGDFVRGVRETNNLYREQLQNLKELEQYERSLLRARQQANDPGTVNRLNAELIRTRRAQEEIMRAGGAAFQAFVNQTEGVARTFADAVRESTAAHQQQLRVLRELEQHERVLLRQRRMSNDPAIVQRLNNELSQTRQAQQQIHQAGGAGFRAFRQEAEGATSGIMGMVKGLGGAVLAAVASTAALSSLAKEAIVVASEFEQTRISFESMLGSKLKADKLQGDLVALAAKTPFEIKDVNEMTKRLIAYGFSAEEIIPNITALGNISAGVGKDKLPQLILAFGQVRAATRLTGMELRQFTEAGVPLLEELSKTMGKPVRELQKSVSEGKVSFQDVQKALMSLSSEGGRFANLMERQSKTLSGVFSNFKDNFTISVLVPIGDFLALLAKPVLNVFNALFSNIASTADRSVGSLLKMKDALNQDINALINNKQATDDVKISKEAEAKIRNDLNKNLKEAGIPLLITEKTTTDELAAALVRVNAELDKKIKRQTVENKLQSLRDKEFDILQRQTEALRGLAEEEKKLAENRNKFASDAAKNARRASGMGIAMEDAQFMQSSGNVSSRQDELKRLNSELSQVRNEFQKTSEDAKVWGVDLSKAAEAPKQALQKTQEEIDKAAKEAEKKAREIEDNEIKRMQLRISLMKEGKDKEVAQEKLKNRQMEIDLNRSLRGRVLNDREYSRLIELNRQDLVDALTDIELKYEAKLITIRGESRKAEAEYDESIRKQRIEAQRSYAQSIQDDTERRIAILDIEFQEKVRQKTQEGALLGELNNMYAEHYKAVAKIRTEANDKAANEQQKAQLLQLDLIKAQFSAEQAVRREQFLSVQRSNDEVKEYDKLEAEAKRKFDLGVQIERLKIELETQKRLSDAATEGGKARIGIIEAQIKEAQAQLQAPAQNDERGGIDSVLSSLGFGAGQITALRKGIDTAKKYIGDFYDYRIKLADELVKRTENEVQSREKALDREIELAQLGYANNIDLRQKELNDAKEANQKALEQQREAQRAKVLLDSVEQGSSLITASANIYKSLSPLGILGVVGATVTIASMLAAFIRAKSKALELTKFRGGGQGFLDGNGIAKGPSHEQEGIKLEIEGDEAFTFGKDEKGRRRFAVVNRKMTSKHFDLLKAINSDDREAMTKHLSELATTNYNTISPIVVKSEQKAQMKEQEQNALLHEMKKNNDFWERSLRSGEVSVFETEAYIMTKKGNTTTIKRK